MGTINTNWTDENGNHQGGQSCGEYFTIAWQGGPLNESGRNGAFLIEVLEACLEWMRNPYHPGVGACGIGFTIMLGIRDGSPAIRTQTLQKVLVEVLVEVLEACLFQVEYFQSQERFACAENAQSIEHLTDACEALPDIDASIVFVQMAQSVLILRRDRRANAGTLGTHQGEVQ